MGHPANRAPPRLHSGSLLARPPRLRRECPLSRPLAGFLTLGGAASLRLPTHFQHPLRRRLLLAV
eukprot:1036995-Prorocentrum_minimum.AAC.2